MIDEVVEKESVVNEVQPLRPLDQLQTQVHPSHHMQHAQWSQSPCKGLCKEVESNSRTLLLVQQGQSLGQKLPGK